jgi:hypothetical protein
MMQSKQKITLELHKSGTHGCLLKVNLQLQITLDPLSRIPAIYPKTKWKFITLK